MGISYKKVKEIAVLKGLKSDNAICARCGIPNGTFYDWKNGSTKSLSEQNIRKLSFGLEVPVDALMSEQTDTVIDMLQELRDDVRGLLDVQKDMTPEQIATMKNFALFLKGQGND